MIYITTTCWWWFTTSWTFNFPQLWQRPRLRRPPPQVTPYTGAQFAFCVHLHESSIFITFILSNIVLNTYFLHGRCNMRLCFLQIYSQYLHLYFPDSIQPQRQQRPPNAKIGARKVNLHGLSNASGRSVARVTSAIVSVLGEFVIKSYLQTRQSYHWDGLS